MLYEKKGKEEVEDKRKYTQKCSDSAFFYFSGTLTRAAREKRDPMMIHVVSCLILNIFFICLSFILVFF